MDAETLTAKTIISPAEMAESGHRVFSDCLGINSNWEQEQLPWHIAAQNADRLISEAMEAEAPMNKNQLAAGIYEWLSRASKGTVTEPYVSLPEITKTAFIAVVNLWWALKTTEEPDVAEAEQTAAGWFNASMARRNGKNDSAPPPQPATGNVSSSPPVVQTAASPAPKITVGKAKPGVSKGFKAAILMMRDYYLDRAARLEQLADKFSDEDDDVLSEVFNILQGDKS